MASQLPVNFAIPGEGAIASYSWQEVAAKTGYNTFYLANFNDDLYGLTTNTILSKYASVVLNNTVEYDFDFLFNSQVTLEGNAYLALPIIFYKYAPGAVTTIEIVATIYHYDGSTETSLGSSTETISSLQSIGDSSITQYFTAKIPISQKNFKAGETLRVNINPGSASSGVAYLGCDPGNRGEAFFNPGSGYVTITTDVLSKVEVPFKIDL